MRHIRRTTSLLRRRGEIPLLRDLVKSRRERNRDANGSMTDSGTNFRSSDEFFQLRDRVAAARAQACAIAERDVQIRRTVDETRREARELRAEAAELRASLRNSVTAYVAELRGADVPPERAVLLVKSAIVESDSYPDKHQREVVEEVVRWAVNAYYAA